MLQPILYAFIFHIPLTFFNSEYTQELSLPIFSLPRSTHMDYRIFNVFVPYHAPVPLFFLLFLPSVAPRLSGLSPESKAVTHKD